MDEEGSLEWPRRGQLNWDGERIVINAQDQGHYTDGFNKMAGLSEMDKCRFCKTETESTNHLLSGCKKQLSEQLYTQRHNKVCKVIHRQICKNFNIPVSENSRKHEPRAIIENQQLTEQEDYHFLLRKSTSGITQKTIQHKKRRSSALTPPTIHPAISAHNPPGNLRPQSPPTIHPAISAHNTPGNLCPQ